MKKKNIRNYEKILLKNEDTKKRITEKWSSNKIEIYFMIETWAQPQNSDRYILQSEKNN